MAHHLSVSGLALALVLAAAVVHATWNLLAKRAAGGVAFFWLVFLVSGIAYAPVALAVAVWQHPRLGAVELGFMAGSAVLHLAYFWLLTRGYRVGDLSLVYPLARGTGPAISTAAAIAFLGERPTPLAVAGAALVVAGVFILAGGRRLFARRDAGVRSAVAYGLLTGAFIASYTLWDKRAVSAFHVPPVLLDWGANAGRVLLLSPLVVRRWQDVRRHWSAHRIETLGMGVLAPLSYILVLTAMVFTPVSYVAPAREVSILVGTAMGARFLAEGDAPRRLAGATAVVLGVMALAIG